MVEPLTSSIWWPEMVAPNDIHKVFAILDEKEAARARASFFQNYRRNAQGFADSLKWMDLDQNGDFLRAGVSNILDRTDTLVHDPDLDADIRQMLDCFAAQAPKPGEIVPVLERDSFIWLLPYAQSSEDGGNETKARALFVTFDLVADSLEHFNEEAGLSRAEKRVICQIALGLTLREAADYDGVSFETKRSQLKTVCLKLDCRGQGDVIRLAMGQLVHLLNMSGNEGDHAQITEDFVADFCPAGTQFKVHRLEDDRYLRVIECGPPEGAPILLFHSMMFAPLLSGAVAELARHRLRLIMPVRPGYLEASVSTAPFDPETIDKFSHDVAAYMQHLQLGPVPILSHGFACTLALRFAELYPALATSMSLMSFPVRGESPDRDTLHRRFFGSFANFAASPNVFRMLAREFRRHYVTPKSMRRAMRRLFRETPADIAAFEGDATRPPLYPALQSSYQSSHAGVADDFYVFYSQSFADAFETAKRPLLCIHGSEDKANPLALVKDLQNGARGDRLAVIEGGGQLCFASHPRPVWHEIARWIDESASA